jgi:hypothetical protein
VEGARGNSNECGSLIFLETAEKDVQDTSCRGSGGVPQLNKIPKIGEFGGETISAGSLITLGG